jgi:hypothetical protein
MDLSRNFLREARQAARLLSPKPQHAWSELSPKPQHRYPLTPHHGQIPAKEGAFYLHDVQLLYTSRVLGGPHTCVRGYSGTLGQPVPE